MSHKKIKIVHIAQADGGIEIYLKMFFKYFNNKEYKNYLILSRKYINSKKEFEKLGIEVFIVDMYREISLIKDIRSIIEIYLILNNIRPDIVYTHSSKAGGLGRIPAKLVGARNIYNPHGWAFDMDISKIKKKLYIYIEKLLGYLTDHIVAISRYEEKVAIVNKIIEEKKIIVIENGIDLEVNKSKNNILNKIGWKTNDIIIGMVARISEQKSPKTFVEIAKKLTERYNRVKFILVGDGDQRDEIEYIIEKNGLKDRFYITGWVDNALEYIEIFNVAILTSKWEGFGLVIPEYMACKKPIVASNVGGIANIIDHEVDGYLVSDLEINKFVNYISILIEDEVIRNRIVENGFEKVKNKYDFKRVVIEHEKLFKQLY